MVACGAGLLVNQSWEQRLVELRGSSAARVPRGVSATSTRGRREKGQRPWRCPRTTADVLRAAGRLQEAMTAIEDRSGAGAWGSPPRQLEAGAR